MDIAVRSPQQHGPAATVAACVEHPRARDRRPRCGVGGPDRFARGRSAGFVIRCDGSHGRGAQPPLSRHRSGDRRDGARVEPGAGRREEPGGQLRVRTRSLRRPRSRAGNGAPRSRRGRSRPADFVAAVRDPCRVTAVRVRSSGCLQPCSQACGIQRSRCQAAARPAQRRHPGRWSRYGVRGLRTGAGGKREATVSRPRAPISVNRGVPARRRDRTTSGASIHSARGTRAGT